MIEWLPGQFTGGIKALDVKGRLIKTVGDTFKADVANVIPAQEAGRLAHQTHLVDQSGWCPIDPMTFESKLQPRFGRKVVVSIQGVQAEAGEILTDGSREVILAEDLDLLHSGAMPLPPYIKRSSATSASLGAGCDRHYREEDEARYQTVFANYDGSLAAPTAGLHFTPEILETLRHVFITLHVGTGTFRPVKSEDITKHRMHPERFSISRETAIAMAKAERIVAVGTTTVRVLESVQRRFGNIQPIESETDIFIYPPFQFGVVDVLLTNFHLPRSTLLMLVSAFAGHEFTLRAYEEAVIERYRFFSYGDCMLIL
jgi:S-adenosylmethionine:tRNA ribosyltransferase-isomerase